MDFKKHLETSWNLTLQFIVPLISMTLVMIFASILTLGILAPVTTAGYMQAILLMIREGREPKVQDVFSRMELFLPLLGFAVILLIAVIVGLTMLILPGILIIFAVSFGCLYMIPLMTDKQFGLIDAIRESISISLQENVVEHAVVVILFMGIMWIGSFVIIGCLFTQPLATVFLLSVYEEKVGRNLQDMPIKEK